RVAQGSRPPRDFHRRSAATADAPVVHRCFRRRDRGRRRRG
ncbi:hypothetical protein chiPu_0032869, partial [Chiloscyllium punctatum]|nr:hypothetical protein [Chiloscyllium punctatum]